MGDSKEDQKPETENGEAKSNRPERLPLLLNLAFTIASLAVILVGLATLLLSLLSGASLLMATFRTGAAMLAVGIVLWLLAWSISSGSLEAVRQEILNKLEEAQRERDPSTVEKVA